MPAIVTPKCLFPERVAVIASPMATPQTEPPALIRISDNTIIDGKFYVRGEPLPFTRVEDLPPNLQPLVVTGEPEEPEEPNVARGSYQTGIVYEMTEDGRLGRALRRNVQRQIAQLEAENERAEWIEAEASGPELPPSIAEDLQAEHENAIALAKAQMAANARRSDEVSDAAAAAAELPRMYVKQAPARRRCFREAAGRPFPMYRHHRRPRRSPRSPH